MSASVARPFTRSQRRQDGEPEAPLHSAKVVSPTLTPSVPSTNPVEDQRSPDSHDKQREEDNDDDSEEEEGEEEEEEEEEVKEDLDGVPHGRVGEAPEEPVEESSESVEEEAGPAGEEENGRPDDQDTDAPFEEDGLQDGDSEAAYISEAEVEDASPSKPPTKLRLFARADGLPERFWLDKECLDLEWLERQIVAHGGQIVTLKKNADWIVLDDRSESYDVLIRGYNGASHEFRSSTTAVSYVWVHDCATYGKRFSEDRYWARDQTHERSKLRIRQKRPGRQPYTEEDKDVLTRHLFAERRRCKKDGREEHFLGNTLYDKLAAKHPKHTSQSWRDHYKHNVSIASSVSGFGTQWGAKEQKRDIEARIDRLHEARRHSSGAGKVVHRKVEHASDSPSALASPGVAGSGSSSPAHPAPRVLPGSASQATSPVGTSGPVVEATAQRARFPAKQAPALPSSPAVSHGGFSLRGAPETSQPPIAASTQFELGDTALALSRHFDGMLSQADASDLLVSCQTIERAENFARHLFPFGYAAVLDTPIAFRTRVMGFLQFNPAVWSPTEDQVVLGVMGTEDERRRLGEMKRSSGVSSQERVAFLRALGHPGSQVGQERFPFRYLDVV